MVAKVKTADVGWLERRKLDSLSTAGKWGELASFAITSASNEASKYALQKLAEARKWDKLKEVAIQTTVAETVVCAIDYLVGAKEWDKLKDITLQGQSAQDGAALYATRKLADGDQLEALCLVAEKARSDKVAGLAANKLASAKSWDVLRHVAENATHESTAKYAVGELANAGEGLHLASVALNSKQEAIIACAVDKLAEAKEWGKLEGIVLKTANDGVAKYVIDKLAEAKELKHIAAIALNSASEIAAKYAVDKLAHAMSVDRLRTIAAKAPRPAMQSYAAQQIQKAERAQVDAAVRAKQWDELKEIALKTADDDVAKYVIDKLAEAKMWRQLRRIHDEMPKDERVFGPRKNHLIQKFANASEEDVDAKGSTEYIAMYAIDEEVAKYAIDKLARAGSGSEYELRAIAIKRASGGVAEHAVDKLITIATTEDPNSFSLKEVINHITDINLATHIVDELIKAHKWDALLDLVGAINTNAVFMAILQKPDFEAYGLQVRNYIVKKLSGATEADVASAARQNEWESVRALGRFGSEKNCKYAVDTAMKAGKWRIVGDIASGAAYDIVQEYAKQQFDKATKSDVEKIAAKSDTPDLFKRLSEQPDSTYSLMAIATYANDEIAKYAVDKLLEGNNSGDVMRIAVKTSSDEVSRYIVDKIIARSQVNAGKFGFDAGKLDRLAIIASGATSASTKNYARKLFEAPTKEQIDEACENLFDHHRILVAFCQYATDKKTRIYIVDKLGEELDKDQSGMPPMILENIAINTQDDEIGRLVIDKLALKTFIDSPLARIGYKTANEKVAIYAVDKVYESVVNGKYRILDARNLRYVSIFTENERVAKYAADKLAEAKEWDFLSDVVGSTSIDAVKNYAKQKFEEATKDDVETASGWPTLRALTIYANEEVAKYAVEKLAEAKTFDERQLKFVAANTPYETVRDYALQQIRKAEEEERIEAIPEEKTAPAEGLKAIADYAKQQFLNTTREDVDALAGKNDWIGVETVGIYANEEVAKHAVDALVKASQRNHATLVAERAVLEPVRTYAEEMLKQSKA